MPVEIMEKETKEKNTSAAWVPINIVGTCAAHRHALTPPPLSLGDDHDGKPFSYRIVEHTEYNKYIIYAVYVHCYYNNIQYTRTAECFSIPFCFSFFSPHPVVDCVPGVL